MPHPMEPRAVRLSFTSLTTRLLPRLAAFPIKALPMPGPKPATRLFSLAMAFSAWSFIGELIANPPTRAGLSNFLFTEMRAGDGCGDYSRKLWDSRRLDDFCKVFIIGRRGGDKSCSSFRLACLKVDGTWSVFMRELPGLRSLEMSGDSRLRLLNEVANACWSDKRLFWVICCIFYLC